MNSEVKPLICVILFSPLSTVSLGHDEWERRGKLHSFKSEIRKEIGRINHVQNFKVWNVMETHMQPLDGLP